VTRWPRVVPNRKTRRECFRRDYYCYFSSPDPALAALPRPTTTFLRFVSFISRARRSIRSRRLFRPKSFWTELHNAQSLNYINRILFIRVYSSVTKYWLRSRQKKHVHFIRSRFALRRVQRKSEFRPMRPMSTNVQYLSTRPWFTINGEREKVRLRFV